MEPPWVGRKKICSNGQDNMTKMAAMPIYGKRKLFFFGTICLISLKLGIQNLALSTTKFVQMMTLDRSLTFLRKDQFWFLIHLYGKMLK